MRSFALVVQVSLSYRYNKPYMEADRAISLQPMVLHTFKQSTVEVELTVELVKLFFSDGFKA